MKQDKYTERLTCRISETEQLTAAAWSMTVECPDAAAKAVPGQFVHILPEGNFTLRRPISICGIDREKGTLRIVFEVRGKGTDALAKLRAGDTVNMLAPLGHGFTLLPADSRVILIGGGIGTPPMLPLAQYYGKNAVVITGFRNRDAVILQEDFAGAGAKTVLCTDDGSAGRYGLVTLPLEEEIEAEKPAAICACGPMKRIPDCRGKGSPLRSRYIRDSRAQGEGDQESAQRRSDDYTRQEGACFPCFKIAEGSC